VGTIDTKKLNAALAKAKNVGLVEEACTIGGCDLVLRSLRSEDYTAVLQDCDGLPEVEYIHRYQKGHIARAIVELNGVDLRGSRFVTVEEPDPATGAMRPVTLELHRYLSDHMLESWGKEVVDVAFRKLGDVLEAAERQAKEGISFVTKDETDEEKYRRLVLEFRATEKDLPATLVDKILDEQGLTRKSTAEELKRAAARTDQLAREQEAKAQEAKAAEAKVEVAAPVAVPAVALDTVPAAALEVPPPVLPAVARPARPVDPHATLQKAIESRKVLEVPVVKSEQEADMKRPPSRSASIAALEVPPDAALPDVSTAVSLQGGDPHEVIEIKRLPIDVQAASTILDNPPMAGLNPRFRPTQRG